MIFIKTGRGIKTPASGHHAVVKGLSDEGQTVGGLWFGQKVVGACGVTFCDGAYRQLTAEHDYGKVPRERIAATGS